MNVKEAVLKNNLIFVDELLKNPVSELVYELIRLACFYNNVTILRYLQMKDPHTIMFYTHTSYFLTTSVEVLKIIHDSCPLINFNDIHNGLSVIQTYAQNNFLEGIKYLNEQIKTFTIPHLNMRVKGKTIFNKRFLTSKCNSDLYPIQIAIMNNHFEVFKYLYTIHMNGKPFKLFNNISLLMSAVHYNSFDIFNFLLENQNYFNTHKFNFDSKGRNIIEYAIWKVIEGDNRYYNALVAKGMTVNDIQAFRVFISPNSFLKACLEKEWNVNTRDSYGHTVLYYAVQIPEPDRLQIVLNHNPDLSIVYSPVEGEEVTVYDVVCMECSHLLPPVSFNYDSIETIEEPSELKGGELLDPITFDPIESKSKYGIVNYNKRWNLVASYESIVDIFKTRFKNSGRRTIFVPNFNFNVKLDSFRWTIRN